MKRCILMMFLALALCSLSVHALALEVAEGVITTQISDRAPVDAVQTYPASVGRLFCFTRVTGAAGDTSVTHVWYRNGVEMLRVELPVRSADWRTWSAKTILPEWTGEWKVEVLDAGGKPLTAIPFTLN